MIKCYIIYINRLLFQYFLTCSHSLLPWQLNQYKEIKHDKEFKITENYCDMVAFLQSNHLKVLISAHYCMHVKLITSIIVITIIWFMFPW